MPSFDDDEFGSVTIRRSAQAKHIRIRVAPDGTLRASLPTYAPVYMVKRLIKQSRAEIRELLREHNDGQLYLPSMTIGKSHTLLAAPKPSNTTHIEKSGVQIILHLAKNDDPSDPHVQAVIRPAVIAALRKEAKSYLPRRLKYLADAHNYSYEKLRFSHSSGRWGSCSSNGTISLNIALMKLPHELIDYVLIHELAHTREMNHSTAFWSHVAHADPSYKIHRSLLKKESPAV